MRSAWQTLARSLGAGRRIRFTGRLQGEGPGVDQVAVAIRRLAALLAVGIGRLLTFVGGFVGGRLRIGGNGFLDGRCGAGSNRIVDLEREDAEASRARMTGPVTAIDNTIDVLNFTSTLKDRPEDDFTAACSLTHAPDGSGRKLAAMLVSHFGAEKTATKAIDTVRAIAPAAIIGFSNPAAARGIAATL